MEATMPRRRLIPERPLTSTERVRRHRLRKRSVKVPPAPKPANYFEAMFPGYSLPTLDEVFAAAARDDPSVEDAA
jgi:hypothetical protein